MHYKCDDVDTLGIKLDDSIEFSHGTLTIDSLSYATRQENKEGEKVSYKVLKISGRFYFYTDSEVEGTMLQVNAARASWFIRI